MSQPSILFPLLLFALAATGVTTTSPNPVTPTPSLKSPSTSPADNATLSGTTFYINTITIPISEKNDTEQLWLDVIQSLGCKMHQLNPGEEPTLNNSVRCPNMDEIHGSGLIGYEDSLAIALAKSNIPPGIILAQIAFSKSAPGTTPSAEVTLRYLKYGNFTTLKLDIPKDIPDRRYQNPQWKEFLEKDFEQKFLPTGEGFVNDSLVFSSEKGAFSTMEGENATAIKIHAARISEWFQLVFGAKEVNGTVVSVNKEGAPWSIYGDRLTLTFDQGWTRNVFETNIQQYNEQHFELCRCLHPRGWKKDCLTQDRFKKYMKYFDTESPMCTSPYTLLALYRFMR